MYSLIKSEKVSVIDIHYYQYLVIFKSFALQMLGFIIRRRTSCLLVITSLAKTKYVSSKFTSCCKYTTSNKHTVYL